MTPECYKKLIKLWQEMVGKPLPPKSGKKKVTVHRVKTAFRAH
jgi:hypothetical protein